MSTLLLYLRSGIHNISAMVLNTNGLLLYLYSYTVEATDSVVKEYEEHEDSVYCVEWSGIDPWVFASLSYDGRLVINHVPNKEKFHILTI